MAFTIPGGQEKGKQLADAKTSTLEWWANSISEKLDDGSARFPDRDRPLLAAMRAELGKRAGGAGGQTQHRPAAPNPPAARSAQTQAIQRSQPQQTGLSLEKLAHDPVAITSRLQDLASKYHLVTPATQVEALPIGFGVAISLVTVDPDAGRNGPGEVYTVGGGKVGLSGTKILEIAGAAGVDWEPRESGRLDNGADPRYCHFRSVGYVKNLDGSERRLIGEVEIDARDGSPQIDEIVTKASAAGRDPASQILELRKFLLRHAETKAKLRAVASMGLKRSYQPSELSRPFAVARLMFTGHCDDPGLREKFALMNAEHAIKGRAALYGAPAVALQRQPAPLPSFRGHEPPPVGAIADDGVEDYGDYLDATGEPKPASSPSNAAPEPATTQETTTDSSETTEKKY